MALLARVDPNKIIIDPTRVRPSEWDLIAVQDDLRAFVTVTRTVKATPVLELVHRVLRLVSGEPFVRAAQEATPPLQEIVCLIEADQINHGESSLFVPVSATALMGERSELDPYQAFEMLSFVFPVTAQEKAQIEQEINRFFATVHENSSTYGGSYGWISDLNWDDTAHRVTWVWARNDQPGQHQQLFLNMLRRIDTRIARLKSWNGLALHLSK